MSSTTVAERPPAAHGPVARAWEAVRPWLLGLWAMGALVYLFIPVLVVVVFSFNDNPGRFNFTWQGFTLCLLYTSPSPRDRS